MSNENKQPDERATFTDLAHEVWSAAQLPPGEGIADGVARIEAILARATQQATKGDQTAIAERCAQFAELYRKEHATSRDAEEACTEIAEACRQYATTPFPVAGSAGQAPIAEIRNVDNPDFEGEQYVHIYPRVKLETGTKLYAAPTAPSLTPERKTSNPHKGGTEAYLATEHFNEGWNACLDARAPSLTTDAGAVLTGYACEAIRRYFGTDLQDDEIRRLLDPGPTEQRMSDAARLATLERVVAGLPQDAIDGGWTARGISAYAKSLEGDAARYRWLRERAWYVDAATYALELRERWRDGDTPPPDVDEIEQALDAARKADIERSGGGDA